jgi:hypothetical protein
MDHDHHHDSANEDGGGEGMEERMNRVDVKGDESKPYRGGVWETERVGNFVPMLDSNEQLIDLLDNTEQRVEQLR